MFISNTFISTQEIRYVNNGNEMEMKRKCDEASTPLKKKSECKRPEGVA